MKKLKIRVLVTFLVLLLLSCSCESKYDHRDLLWEHRVVGSKDVTVDAERSDGSTITIQLINDDGWGQLRVGYCMPIELDIPLWRVGHVYCMEVDGLLYFIVTSRNWVETHFLPCFEVIKYENKKLERILFDYGSIGDIDADKGIFKAHLSLKGGEMTAEHVISDSKCQLSDNGIQFKNWFHTVDYSSAVWWNEMVYTVMNDDGSFILKDRERIQIVREESTPDGGRLVWIVTEDGVTAHNVTTDHWDFARLIIEDLC